MYKRIAKFLPITFFCFGILSSFIWEFKSKNEGILEKELTFDNLELFQTIASNNYLVCIIIILGFLTLGISSLAILVYNGYIFGFCLQILPYDKIPYNFLSYSLLESLGFILSCQIALNISIIIVKNLVKNLNLKVNIKKTFVKILYISILILTASLIEVYVSIN